MKTTQQQHTSCVFAAVTFGKYSSEVPVHFFKLIAMQFATDDECT